jgi:hypothetical protein
VGVDGSRLTDFTVLHDKVAAFDLQTLYYLR